MFYNKKELCKKCLDQWKQWQLFYFKWSQFILMCFCVRKAGNITSRTAEVETFLFKFLFCLDFDLAVNVWCLEIFFFRNLFGRHCERIRLSLQFIVCPRLSLCSRLAKDGKQYKFLNLFWVTWFIGCTQKHPIHPVGKTTHLRHRRWLPCAQRICLKRVKFRSVINFGTATELHYLIIHMRTVLVIAVCYNVKVT